LSTKGKVPGSALARATWAHNQRNDVGDVGGQVYRGIEGESIFLSLPIDIHNMADTAILQMINRGETARGVHFK
jgi:hypothetical protein